jgi:rhodanese-related sulfurtransferase
MDIATIGREELGAKLDRGDDFELVLALNEWAYRAEHIPGSLHFPSIEAALAALDVDDEIVVYCSDAACVASRYAYEGLVERGYKNVRRYEGGLSDWAAAGYPLEGAAVD